MGTTISMLQNLRQELRDGNLEAQALTASLRIASTTAQQSQELSREALAENRHAADEVAKGWQQASTETESRLASLRRQVGEFSGGFADEIGRQLAALDAGAISLDEFLRKFGDAEIQTADGVQRIREQLDGIDPKGRQDELQELIRAYQKGAADIGDVLEELTSTGFDVAKQLANMIRAYQQGSATLEDVIALARAAKEQFRGSNFGTLAEEIERAAAGGDLT